jgi:hypothetical protein
MDILLRLRLEQLASAMEQILRKKRNGIIGLKPILP